MNTASLIRKGLTRNKVQFVLTAASIFIAFCLFGLLNAFRYAFESRIDMAAATRLVTLSKASFGQSLPLSYWKQIESIEGVDRVTHFTIFSGYYQDQQNPLSSYAVDADSVSSVYNAEMAITPAQLDAWKRIGAGAAVGRVLAEKYGWHVGSHVPIMSQVWEREDGAPQWELEIAAILDIPRSSPYASILFMHYDYFDQARAAGKGTVGYYVLRTKNPRDSQAVADRIDARFANSAGETRTASEKAMLAFFARQYGDIGVIVTAILGAVFFTILLVIGNSMSRSVRERRRELLVMRSIGFADAKVIALVLLEGVSLTLIAGVPALLLSWLISAGISARFSSVVAGMRVTSGMVLAGLALMVLLGIVSSIFPVLRVVRMNMASGLRRA